jgi:hypothetical protein
VVGQVLVQELRAAGRLLGGADEDVGGDLAQEVRTPSVPASAEHVHDHDGEHRTDRDRDLAALHGETFL